MPILDGLLALYDEMIALAEGIGDLSEEEEKLVQRILEVVSE